MNKAILVIDMPSSCEECPIRSTIGYGKWCAGFDDSCIDSYPIKPDWCPLKLAPEKPDIFDDIVKAKSDNAYEVGLCMYNRGFNRGYNACIDKILGT